MNKKGICVAISISILFSSAFVYGNSGVSDSIYSAGVSQAFLRMADKVSCESGLDCTAATRGIILLEAAQDLDPQVVEPLDQILDFANLNPDTDYSDLVYSQLLLNVDNDSDIEPALRAITYMMARKNSREERQKLLEKLVGDVKSANPYLASDVGVELGLLATETADFDNAIYYFTQAYQFNPYNELAFSKLVELAPDTISIVLYGSHLRRMMVVNPFNLDYALEFARYCSNYGMYDVATGIYEYSYKLFKFLNPDKPITQHIYLPWARNAYSSSRGGADFFNVVNTLRNDGVVDLEVESLAIMASPENVGESFDSKVKNLEQKAMTWKAEGKIDDYQLAWFYSFVMNNPEKALEKANEVFAKNPDSVAAKAIFAYALVINDQGDMAKEVIDENYKVDQISALSYAKALLSGEQKQEAIKVLKEAIKFDTTTLVSENCKTIVKEQGADFIEEFDSKGLAAAIGASFISGLIPEFKEPGELFEFKVNTAGKEFLYSSEIKANIAFVNNSKEPIIISDNSFIAGFVRIDAEITGDFDISIPAIVNRRIRPGIAIEPGKSAYFDIRLDRGALYSVLKDYPQADINVKFNVFLDTVEDDGKMISGLGKNSYASVEIKRTGVDYSRKYLIQKLDTFENGRLGQKIAAADLFAGLLAEQAKLSGKEPLYRYKVTPPELLYSAFVRALTEEEWEVRVHAMKALKGQEIPYDVISAVASNLNSEMWPVRLAALDILSTVKGKGFESMIKWVQQSETNELVNDYATSIIGK